MAKKSTKNTSTTTFAAAMNYICQRQPKIAIFENVENAPWESVQAYVLPLCGYASVIRKLDTKNYYLPQTRSRKYLVAFSHAFFGVEGAQELCNLFGDKVKGLERRYSSSVTDFLLPINSHELHRARNEMELACQSTREKDTDWSFSKARHAAFRRLMQLPDERPWIRWSETSSYSAPAKMWKQWEAKQPKRVIDLMDIIFLVSILGKNRKHGAYDPAFKAQVIDCSQNVDRVNITTAFGGTGCITPNAIPMLTIEARPVTGTESLKIQGLPVENFDRSVETQAQLQDLAGNAMSTTVVGATILAALQCIGELDGKLNNNWLPNLFPRRGYKRLETRDCNSFHVPDQSIDMGECLELDELVLSAHSRPRETVQEVLDLGNKVRRRCVCYHILAYSSMELYECTVCGASFCKSCKGNPDHQLEKAAQSYEEIGCLNYAHGEYQLRQFFPSILPMLADTDNTFSAGELRNALLPCSYTDRESSIYANAILAGLCNTTYELAFIEVTDAIRVEYVSTDNFILRVIVNEDKLIWYLYLNEWSPAGMKLSSHNTITQPVAQAIVGPDASSQFPTDWQIWLPRKVEFHVTFLLGEDKSLYLATTGDLQELPGNVQDKIRALEDSRWDYHPECGFPEKALWVNEDQTEKLYLFKDVDPIGEARLDEFVISSVNREMGRTPQAECRPFLLRIHCEDQIHRVINSILDVQDDLKDKHFTVRASVPGWWVVPQEHLFGTPTFINDVARLSLQGFPVCPPVKIRLPSDDSNVTLHGPAESSRSGKFPCHRDQVLVSMSLPIFGMSKGAIREVVDTLRDLDPYQKLDLGELVRLVGPCYTAVEREIINQLGGSKTLELWKNVDLYEDCGNCAPQLPESFWAKPEGKGSRSMGSIVARHRKDDREQYNYSLGQKPVVFRIDHNVDSSLVPHHKKQKGVSYVDIRFVGRAHTLLQQARSHLPKHPLYHDDPHVTQGTLALDFGILEDSRMSLKAINIEAPKSLEELGVDPKSKQPKGFRGSESLFEEQLATLEWMLTREDVDETQLTFTEREVAEVYIDHLRLRVKAQAARPIVRRGRVVADGVGFGKTIVCLGLIDRQYETDRAEFLSLRTNNFFVKDLCHLRATLVIVPNQLTRQWVNEARRFLKADYNICMIQSFAGLQGLGIDALEKADIIICSNKVFQETRYQKELAKFCDHGNLDVKASPKVYRAWYKKVHEVLYYVREKMLEIYRAKGRNRTVPKNLLDALKVSLEEWKEEKENPKEQLGFLTSPTAATSPAPSILLELFSFSRVIWDEYPYENVQVAEFVANCATVSKWMLSGTPPVTTLGDASRVAYLFNVHLARPLALVSGRQPPACENPPQRPLSQLEEAGLYQSRPSPLLLRERHAQAIEFVQLFMRKNVRKMEAIASVEKPLVLTASTNSLMAYLELQHELRSRAYNANTVPAEPRRRLMSRVDWKGSKLGRDRAMEALVLRASASFDDVIGQLGIPDQPGNSYVGKSSAEVSRILHEMSVKTVQDMEDRGRELIGRAFYLGYRIAYLNVKNHVRSVDNQENRQFSYYESLQQIVNDILAINVEAYSGWDAFKSALRILIWDQDFHYRLELGDGPSESPPLPPTSDRDAWKAVVKDLWDKMEFGRVPDDEPSPTDESTEGTARGAALAKKKDWLREFSVLLLKTPLHSRRWFLTDQLSNASLATVRSILRMEWEYKVPWEAEFRNTPFVGQNDYNLVPIRKLHSPEPHLVPTQLNIGRMKELDRLRRKELTEVPDETIERVKQGMMSRLGVRKTNLVKGDWQEECNRRGIVYKSTDKVGVLRDRVGLAEENKASDDAYVTPEGCPLVVENLPLEGKQRIRGGNMEVVFDRLMHTIDKQIVTHERLVVAHSRKNLQEVIWSALTGAEHGWECPVPGCDKDKDNKPLLSHYVSLLCGHIQCTVPDDDKDNNDDNHAVPLDTAVCGVRGCTQLIKGMCIPISKFTARPRVIRSRDLGKGALSRDPGDYLDRKDEGAGAKVTAIIRLIQAMDKADQVVVFVQNQAIMADLHVALAASKISHVTAQELATDEAGALEDFKRSKSKQVLVQMINSEQAAGSNLHNANHIIFVSPLVTRNQAEWDAQMKQALGRCVRFRQTKTVYIYHLLIDETVEVDTLEWRMKKEILVPRGKAVGRFSQSSVTEFLERFDTQQVPTTVDGGKGEEEDRAISMLPRDDIQLLMGDDYISLMTARSTRTIGCVEEGEEEEEQEQDDEEKVAKSEDDDLKVANSHGGQGDIRMSFG